MISIGTTVKLTHPITDLSGEEHEVGKTLVVEKAAHENTHHPIVLATPSDWTRHAITHQTFHPIEIGGSYCFYAEDLREATK